MEITNELLLAAGMPAKKIEELTGPWEDDGLSEVFDAEWTELIDSYIAESGPLQSDQEAIHLLADAVRDYSDRYDATWKDFESTAIDYFMAEIPENDKSRDDIYDHVVEHCVNTSIELLDNTVDRWQIENCRHGDDTGLILPALFAINRHAKRLRDFAAESYESKEHAFAGVASKRKEQIYEVKSLTLQMLVRTGELKLVGQSENFVCIRGQGHCFHSPSGGFDLAGLPEIVFEGEQVEAKSIGTEEMSINDAWATVTAFTTAATKENKEKASQCTLPPRKRQRFYDGYEYSLVDACDCEYDDDEDEDEF